MRCRPGTIQQIQRVPFERNRIASTASRWQRTGTGKKKDETNQAVSVRELYARVVGEGGVHPSYFLDKMTFAEVVAFLDGLNRRNRESWEQTRIVAHVIAQANSTKQLEASDVLRFPWDEEQDKKKRSDVSDEDIKRLRKEAKLIEQQIQ